MRRKQNFEFLGLKVTQQSRLFLFAWFLLGFILVGKVFCKAFRTLGLDERKGRGGSGTRFSRKFSGQCYMVCLPFSPVTLTELCSFWYGLKDLFTLHTLADKTVLDY